MTFIILKKCGQIHTGLFRSFRFCRFQQTNAFIQIPGHQLVHPFAIFISQGFMGCHPQKLSGCLPVALNELKAVMGKQPLPHSDWLPDEPGKSLHSFLLSDKISPVHFYSSTPPYTTRVKKASGDSFPPPPWPLPG